MDLDDHHEVQLGPDLGPNCLQTLSADDTGRQRVIKGAECRSHAGLCQIVKDSPKKKTMSPIQVKSKPGNLKGMCNLYIHVFHGMPYQIITARSRIFSN